MGRHLVSIHEALNKIYTLKLNNGGKGCIINFSPKLAGYKIKLLVIEGPAVIRENGDSIIKNSERIPNLKVNTNEEPEWIKNLPLKQIDTPNESEQDPIDAFHKHLHSQK